MRLRPQSLHVSSGSKCLGRVESYAGVGVASSFGHLNGSEVDNFDLGMAFLDRGKIPVAQNPPFKCCGKKDFSHSFLMRPVEIVCKQTIVMHLQ